MNLRPLGAMLLASIVRRLWQDAPLAPADPAALDGAVFDRS